jgi:predicted ATPase/DNA-binding XRE family transcriptional regulator
VADQAVLSFGELLRRLRAEARLTQEELAEAAQLSPRSISDLERGVNRTARKDTAGLLADALHLDWTTRELFVAAARGRVPAAEVLAAREGRTPGALGQQVPSPSVRHNLPAPLTSFLDREQALPRLEKLLSEARLVTLTGTGGAGKTRLALEVGARAVRSFPGGVWLADLAAITDPGLVAVQVMEALGVRQAGDEPVLEALRFRLRSVDLLLVLDNCEHLLDGCVQLAYELLGSSPGLRLLATSREPLGVPGEVSYLVPPLELPPDSSDVQAIAAAPAVRLFLERGSAARGGGNGGDVPVAVVERICRRLDGLPLAIELAAARLGTLSAAEIEAHLADRFRFLAYRRPAPHPRHQALQAAMDWSYELLSAEERQVFCDLSVFAGIFGREQAAMVCGGDQVAALEVIDRLAAKSLVAAEPAEEGTRYRLLETVRQYAADRLAEAGGTEPARQRHALAFLALAEGVHELAVLAREHDNFRAALDWSLSAGDPAGPLLARALGDFWLGRGLLQEGREWLERALAQPPPDARLRAGLLRLLGTVLYEVGDLRGADAALSDGLEVAAAAGALADQARLRVQLTELHKRHNLPGGGGTGALEECEAAIAVLNVAGDQQGLAEAWLLVGKLRFDRNEWPAAQEAMERAIDFGRRSGNHRAWILASTWLSSIFMMSPIPADAAVERAEEWLHRVEGEPFAEEGVLMSLATLYAYAGRIADARVAIKRSNAIVARCGSKLGFAFGAISAGEIEMVAGDPAAAERCFREGYEVFRAMGERWYLGQIAGLLAHALYAQGLFGEAQQVIEEAEITVGPIENEGWMLWRSAKAKVLAQRGQFFAARQLIAKAEEENSSASWVIRAKVLMAKAEVSRLAGDPDQAAASLRAALWIYEDRHVLLLAGQAKAMLASHTAHPGRESNAPACGD